MKLGKQFSFFPTGCWDHFHLTISQYDEGDEERIIIFRSSRMRSNEKQKRPMKKVTKSIIFKYSLVQI